MIEFTLTLEGTAPLLMHNARLSDPLDPATKAVARVSSKRKKTEDDHEELAHLEFLGGLYIDPDIGPYIPGENIAATLFAAAKLNRLGTTVKRGLLIQTDINPLGYEGPRDGESMWKKRLQFSHRGSVVVSGKRVIRTRPCFRDWRVQCDGILDESQLDLDQVTQIAENAGAFIGLGDWRPRFGRFIAKVEKR